MSCLLLVSLLCGSLLCCTKVGAQGENSTNSTTGPPTTNSTTSPLNMSSTSEVDLTLTSDDDTHPPYIYVLISVGVVVFIGFITVLVALLLHRVHVRMSAIKSNKTAKVESNGDTHSQDPPSPSAYDDVLSFSEILRKTPQDNEATGTAIATACNEAYGVAPSVSNGQLPLTPCTSKGNLNKAKSKETAVTIEPLSTVYDNIDYDNGSLERNSAYNEPIETWIERNASANVGGTQDKDDDDDPDYENLVSPDHLFGEYVIPEFVRPSSSAEVQSTLKSVEYSELKDYPLSGKMTMSKSLPDVVDQLQGEGRHVLSKQKSWEKSDRIRVTLPTNPNAPATLV